MGYCCDRPDHMFGGDCGSTLELMSREAIKCWKWDNYCGNVKGKAERSADDGCLDCEVS